MTKTYNHDNGINNGCVVNRKLINVHTYNVSKFYSESPLILICCGINVQFFIFPVSCLI